MDTIGARIAKTGGYTSGFDYLRLILSLMVLFLHSFFISGDNDKQLVMPWGIDSIVNHGILPMFFALSGFLVSASLMRTKSLIVFLSLRGLRIVPALFVEITLSALVLGPLLTTFTLQEYFSDKDFYLYFLNIIGYIHYQLPGLFLDHPYAGIVNGSLWTVPYEAECYIALALLSVVGIIKSPRLFLTGFIILCLGLLALTIWQGGDPEPKRVTATGRQLVLFFLGGVLVYLFRDRIPYSRWLAIGAAVVSCTLIASHTYIYLLPLPVAYMTAYIGLLEPKKLPVVFTGDYSYGIYLYGGPIQQAVYYFSAPDPTWQMTFLISLVVVSVFAAFSWHAIEKPMLKLKRFILTKADRASPAKGEMISPDKTITEVAEGDAVKQTAPSVTMMDDARFGKSSSAKKPNS